MNARIAAVRCLVSVLGRGEMLDTALPAATASLPARDRALAQEIVYGVLRWHYRFLPVLDRLLRRPLQPADLDLRVLLLAALHELEHLRTPDHAAVSEAVEGTRLLGKPWAAGLANAVLRRFQRERASLLEDTQRDDSAKFAHPAWLIDALRQDWPDDWQALLDRNNERPPMDLRVNLTRATRDEYLAMLLAAGITARPLPWCDSGVRLDTAVSVDALPGFTAGLATVQDAAAQLAAPLLDAQPGERVLDACAAPGGKASHILERTPRATLVAVDQGARRIQLLRETLGRLGLAATVIDGDSAAPTPWWDGVPFQRVLLDAPCSATGVIRRHPDVKLLRRPDQLPRLERQQEALLGGLWPTLARGGRLLYVTCSLLRRENDRQIEKFIAAHKDARVLPLAAPWGLPTTWGRHTLPSRDDCDGFYYALLERL